MQRLGGQRHRNDERRIGREPDTPGHDAVILVVDDDPVTRATFAMVLSGMGPRVLEASSGPEALSLAAAQEVALVVLTDRLPGTPGLEVLGELRARASTAEVPVIFVAGVADASERARAMDGGAQDYLVKPVDMGELRAHARNHLRRVHDRLHEAAPTSRVASAANSLLRAGMNGSMELIAAAACRQLGRLHDGVDLTLHAFMGEGLTECLAEHRRGGETTPGGRPLTTDVARRAYQRAGGGPWLETTHDALLHVRDTRTLLPGPRAAAWVPLVTDNQVLGVVVISAQDPVSDDVGRVGEAMASAIELAPTISSILGPRLETLTDSEKRRARLRRAMQGSFFPVFQPIMALGDRRVEGYEALTRFEDGAPPDMRLAEAASLGGLVPLEASLCRAALGAVPDLPHASWVALNASPSLLLDIETMHEVMDAHHGPPVVIEVTEHDGIDDYSAVRRAVDELGVDVRLSVDDVGDRWSCLRHIIDLRPSFIKVDTGWVRGIEGDPTRQALVRGLSRFSKRNGCEVIAEGIETERQLETLLELEVGLGQGFHLGRPSRSGGAAPAPLRT